MITNATAAVVANRCSLLRSAPKITGTVSISKRGTRAFMVRMAKVTPSGKEVYFRSIMVSRPHPQPNSSLPMGLTGDVTMSVAM